MGVGNITIYAQWDIIDTTPPTLARVNVDANAGVGNALNRYWNVTYSFSGTQSGVAGYYWGTTYPSATNVAYTPYTGSSVTVTWEYPDTGDVHGHWKDTIYFAVKDNKGNITVNTFKGMIISYEDHQTPYGWIDTSEYNYMGALANDFDTYYIVSHGESDLKTYWTFTGNHGIGPVDISNIDQLVIRWSACCSWYYN